MNESIGNRIAKYRKAKGLTQEGLASQMGVSSQAVSKWETDASCPDISALPHLCKILGITTDELLTGKTEEVKMVPPAERKGLDELILRVKVFSTRRQNPCECSHDTGEAGNGNRCGCGAQYGRRAWGYDEIH